jgi:BirA family transcriptional regulator, biotin operon repressor / biotin---[acetyl-CoA-carboxylase] ligase
VTVDSQILKALRENQDGVSGADLSEQLGISRAAIWARIHDLRLIGYHIEASPHFGYRLLSSPDALHADDLISRLGHTKTIGRDIRVFNATPSTNDLIAKCARDGLQEGIVIFAESQSKGRGRLGREWLSPAKAGLWFSILLRPSLRPQQTTQLTIMSATALRRAIEAGTGLSPEIKWPNDIVICGKKVAGILTELYAELDRVNYIILGVGVNVNLTLTDFTPELRKLATSVQMELGKPISRPELAVRILRELDNDYRRVRAGEFAAVATEWEQHCSTLGREITIRTGERNIRGVAESLGEEGALLLRSEHGHLERIVGGDVTVSK